MTSLRTAKITTITLFTILVLGSLLWLGLLMHASVVQSTLLTRYGAAGASQLDSVDNAIAATHQECLIDLPSWEHANKATLVYECLPWVNDNTLATSGSYLPVAAHAGVCTTSQIPGISDGTLTPCPSVGNPNPVSTGCPRSSAYTDAPCYFSSARQYCQLTASTIYFADVCSVGK